MSISTISLRSAIFPRSSAITNVLFVGAGTLFLAGLAQIALPIPGSPVPVTGQTLGVLLIGTSYGATLGLSTLLTYLLVGLVGASGLCRWRSWIIATYGRNRWVSHWHADRSPCCWSARRPQMGSAGSHRACGNTTRETQLFFHSACSGYTPIRIRVGDGLSERDSRHSSLAKHSRLRLLELRCRWSGASFTSNYLLCCR